MAKTEWLAFWAKVGPAVLEFGQALYRHFDGDPAAAIQHVKRISTDFPKFEAARDEAQQGFAELKRAEEPTYVGDGGEMAILERAPEPMPEPAEPDNEYVDPADHAPPR